MVLLRIVLLRGKRYSRDSVLAISFYCPKIHLLYVYVKVISVDSDQKYNISKIQNVAKYIANIIGIYNLCLYT